MPVPSVPEGAYVDIGDGQRIHLHEQGEGPAVLMVHGSGPGASGWSNFKHNYPVIAAAGYRVLVPDLLGFGYSSMDAGDLSVSAQADAMRRMLDGLGIEQVLLVGNSFGGALCIEFQLRWPERVRAMVLMAPGGLEERDVYMQMPGIKAMIKAAYTPGGFTMESMRGVFGLQMYDPARVTDEILRERLEVAELQPHGIMARLKVENLRPRLAEISCPTLTMWGMNDNFCPPSGAQAIATSCSRARVLLLTECGHWVMVEHPELFNRECIAFFDEQGLHAS